jgi:hypothetical protein
MAVKLILREDQLYALSVIRDLGPECLQSINDKISAVSPSPIKPAELRTALLDVLPDSPEKVEIILEQLLSLYTLQRQSGINASEVVEGLTNGIESAENQWSESEFAKWKDIQPQLKSLFDIQNIMSVAKSLDLAYDYSKLLQSVKILTDIRPVYNVDATEIQGSVISFTLRIRYDSREGNKNISITLDESDVRNLIKASKRALKKAETAKRFITERSNTNAFICGEEE